VASPEVVTLRAAPAKSRRRRWRAKEKVRPISGAETRLLEQVGESPRRSSKQPLSSRPVAPQRWF